LALGAAFKKALGERKGIKRYGYAYAPLDEVSFLSAPAWDMAPIFSRVKGNWQAKKGRDEMSMTARERDCGSACPFTLSPADKQLWPYPMQALTENSPHQEAALLRLPIALHPGEDRRL
jgi:hypothetical protein